MSTSTPSARKRTTSIDVAFQQAEKTALPERMRRRLRRLRLRMPGAKPAAGRRRGFPRQRRPRKRCRAQQPAELRAVDLGDDCRAGQDRDQARAGDGSAETMPRRDGAYADARRRQGDAGHREAPAPAAGKMRGCARQARRWRKPPKPARAGRADARRRRRKRRSRSAPEQATAPVEAAKPATPAAARPAGQRRQPDKAATVEARRDSDGLRVTFSFAAPTPAALFRRADTVWLVFDQTDAARPRADPRQGRRDHRRRQPAAAGQGPGDPHSPQPAADAFARQASRAGGTDWTLTFADTVQAPPQPLMVMRNITDPALANVSVPLANPGLLHRLIDPDAGDTLLVVTAPPPIRGFIKRQDFVELSLLESVPRRRGPSEFRRRHRRDRRRQGHARPAGRADAVVGRRRRRTRDRGGAAAVRRRRMAQEPGREFSRAPGCADQGRGRRAEPEQKTQARLDLARFYMSRACIRKPRASPT